MRVAIFNSSRLVLLNRRCRYFKFSVMPYAANIMIIYCFSKTSFNAIAYVKQVYKLLGIQMFFFHYFQVSLRSITFKVLSATPKYLYRYVVILYSYVFTNNFIIIFNILFTLSIIYSLILINSPLFSIIIYIIWNKL